MDDFAALAAHEWFVPALVGLAVFAVAQAQILAGGKRRSPSTSRRPPFRQPPPLRAAPTPTAQVGDAADQLRIVMGAEFTKRSVLSKTEARVMAAAEAGIREAGVPWRVMAQVSLGEVLASPSEAAFRAINAKRVDLLVVSERSEPLAAIEYQGQGHYQGTAPARDAIKKEALRRAGIGYIEITFEHGPEDVRREIARLAFKYTCETQARDRAPAASDRSLLRVAAAPRPAQAQAPARPPLQPQQ